MHTNSEILMSNKHVPKHNGHIALEWSVETV